MIKVGDTIKVNLSKDTIEDIGGYFGKKGKNKYMKINESVQVIDKILSVANYQDKPKYDLVFKGNKKTYTLFLYEMIVLPSEHIPVSIF